MPLEPIQIGKGLPNHHRYGPQDRTTSGHLQERQKRKKNSALRGGTIDRGKISDISFEFLIVNTCELCKVILPFNLQRHVHLKHLFNIGRSLAVAAKAGVSLSLRDHSPT
jgi:hypothetical protein